MRKAKIKTLDITAKEWFDRVNGNSYFAARIVVNFGLKSEQTILLPFQYGYGEQYIYAAATELVNREILAEAAYKNAFTMRCRDNGIILRYSKQENCLKRDVKAFGEM